MALVLVILAVGSVLAGYVGIPHALGGQNQLAAWLAPSFAPPPGTPDLASLGLEGAGQEAAGPAAASLELTLMAVSSAIAIGGILLASYIWLRRRELAAALADRFRAVYTLMLHKYYVDEMYDAAVVRPMQRGSEQLLWRGVDMAVVDGAVNGAGTIVAEGSMLLRRLQTGSVRAYAGSMFIGVIVILGYYLWR